MRFVMLLIGTFLLTTAFAAAEERKAPFDKGLKKGRLQSQVKTFNAVGPRKTCEGGCPTPLYKWPCKDSESCGINCAANPPYGYCY